MHGRPKFVVGQARKQTLKGFEESLPTCPVWSTGEKNSPVIALLLPFDFVGLLPSVYRKSIHYRSRSRVSYMRLGRVTPRRTYTKLNAEELYV